MPKINKITIKDVEYEIDSGMKATYDEKGKTLNIVDNSSLDGTNSNENLEIEVEYLDIINEYRNLGLLKKRYAKDWLVVVSKPISEYVVNMIKKTNLVCVRFNYLIQKRSGGKNKDSTKFSKKKYGFANSFFKKDKYGNVTSINNIKKQILKENIIAITPEDIKVKKNVKGEKVYYIYKVIDFTGIKAKSTVMVGNSNELKILDQHAYENGITNTSFGKIDWIDIYENRNDVESSWDNNYNYYKQGTYEGEMMRPFSSLEKMSVSLPRFAKYYYYGARVKIRVADYIPFNSISKYGTKINNGQIVSKCIIHFMDYEVMDWSTDLEVKFPPNPYSNHKKTIIFSRNNDINNCETRVVRKEGKELNWDSYRPSVKGYLYEKTKVNFVILKPDWENEVDDMFQYVSPIHQNQILKTKWYSKGECGNFEETSSGVYFDNTINDYSLVIGYTLLENN